MKLATATALALAALLAGSTAGMAAGKPVLLSNQQRTMQNDETTVLNLLSAKGYADVTNIQRTGANTYGATVTKNGQPTPVTVDVTTGDISGL
jgi:hypothetical protein